MNIETWAISYGAPCVLSRPKSLTNKKANKQTNERTKWTNGTNGTKERKMSEAQRCATHEQFKSSYNILDLSKLRKDEWKIYDYSDFYDQLSAYSLHSTLSTHWASYINVTWALTKVENEINASNTLMSTLTNIIRLTKRYRYQNEEIYNHKSICTKIK